MLECVSIMPPNLGLIAKTTLNLYSGTCLYSNAREVETEESEPRGYPLSLRTAGIHETLTQKVKNKVQVN